MSIESIESKPTSKGWLFNLLGRRRLTAIGTAVITIIPNLPPQDIGGIKLASEQIGQYNTLHTDGAYQPAVDFDTQLLHGSNSRLHTPTINSEFSYVVTHPGYVEQSIRSAVDTSAQDMEADRDYYRRIGFIAAQASMPDKYNDYAQNLSNLMVQLGKTASPSLVNIEYDAVTGLSPLDFEASELFGTGDPEPRLIPREFVIPDNSFVGLTTTADGKLVKNIDTSKGPVIQDPNAYYNMLRQLGISEVRVAGEYAYVNGHYGCLGATVLQFLAAGFRVRGIEGAVFPQEPPEASSITSPEMKSVVEALYFDKVDINYQPDIGPNLYGPFMPFTPTPVTANGNSNNVLALD